MIRCRKDMFAGIVIPLTYDNTIYVFNPLHIGIYILDIYLSYLKLYMHNKVCHSFNSATSLECVTRPQGVNHHQRSINILKKCFLHAFIHSFIFNRNEKHVTRRERDKMYLCKLLYYQFRKTMLKTSLRM